MSAINVSIPNNDIPSLTGLRFLAALSVAMAHGSLLVLNYSGPRPTFFHYMSATAGFGMTLFFVLSGFVIHHNYKNLVQTGLPGVGKFFWARFARLYPLFALVLLTDILLGNWNFRQLANGGSAVVAGLEALPYFLLLIQTWVYKIIGTNSLVYQLGVNTPLTWSISTEWFFYLAYPAVCYFLIKLNRLLFIISSMVVLSAVWIIGILLLSESAPQINSWAIATYGPVADVEHGFQDSFFRWVMYFSPYIRIGEFILGCLTAQLYALLLSNQPGKQERKLAYAIQVFSIASIVFIIWAQYSPNVGANPLRDLNKNFGLAPSIALLIFACARYQTPISRFLSARPMIVGGNASYSIYLIHFLIFWLIAAASPIPADFAFLLTRFVFGLALIIILSIGLHAAFEDPARRWLRKQLMGANERFPIIVLLILVLPFVAAASSWYAHGYITGKFADEHPTSGLQIKEATYGANCDVKNTNATGAMRQRCNGESSCTFRVDVRFIGDPAPGCAKNFQVSYVCLPNTDIRTAVIPAEAGLGGVISVRCE